MRHPVNDHPLTAADRRLCTWLSELPLRTIRRRILQTLLTDKVCSEYDMLRLLQTEQLLAGPEGFDGFYSLYCRHFVLRHCCYGLRLELLAQAKGLLGLDMITIALSPYQAGQDGLCRYDKLQDFYLDLNHLPSYTPQQVQWMLGDFWRRFDRHQNRRDALAVLGLQDPVEDSQLVRCYRKLVMQHHPDRGGDGKRLQEINQAYRLLRS